MSANVSECARAVRPYRSARWPIRTKDPTTKPLRLDMSRRLMHQRRAINKEACGERHVKRDMPRGMSKETCRERDLKKGIIREAWKECLFKRDIKGEALNERHVKREACQKRGMSKERHVKRAMKREAWKERHEKRVIREGDTQSQEAYNVSSLLKSFYTPQRTTAPPTKIDFDTKVGVPWPLHHPPSFALSSSIPSLSLPSAPHVEFKSTGLYVHTELERMRTMDSKRIAGLWICSICVHRNSLSLSHTQTRNQNVDTLLWVYGRSVIRSNCVDINSLTHTHTQTHTESECKEWTLSIR